MSERSVDDAAVPPDVSTQTRPVDVVRRIPAVVVPRDNAPVLVILSAD